MTDTDEQSETPQAPRTRTALDAPTAAPVPGGAGAGRSPQGVEHHTPERPTTPNVRRPRGRPGAAPAPKPPAPAPPAPLRPAAAGTPVPRSWGASSRGPRRSPPG